MTHRDSGIDTILDLNGSIFDQGGGFWIKIEAKKVAANEAIPHGIKYSLTLHNPFGLRILGYDNAHGVKPPKKYKYSGKRFTYDHRHRHVSDKGVPYEFKSAQQLLEDFFAEVDKVLLQVNSK